MQGPYNLNNKKTFSETRAEALYFYKWRIVC